MDCRKVLESITAAVDNELTVSEALELERHLAGCQPCSRAYAAQQALHAYLRASATRHPVPPELARRVDALLESGRPTRLRWQATFWRFAPAMSVALAIGWTAGWLGTQVPSAARLGDELVASHVRALMASRAVDVDTSDRHTVKPWFGGRLAFSPRVADLSADGFPLVGGRLDFIENRPVAALVYRHDQHLIDVYQWPAPADANRVANETRRGYHLIHWVEAGMTFWVVSDLEASELAEFARLLRAGGAR